MLVRQNHLLLPILIAILCLLISCSEGPSTQNQTALTQINSIITFKVHEEHKEYNCNCEPSIVLSMATEEWYSCSNFSIVSEISQVESTITVNLLGIYMPEICLPAFGQATSRKFLNITPGVYSLNFIHGFFMDMYRLIVTDSSIEVNKILKLFTRPEFELYWRYPPNSFVYLCGTTTETSWICDDFLFRLLSETELEEFQFPDYGEICYPRSSMGHYYDMPAKYFIYNKEEDFDKGGEILESYTQSVIVHYSGVGISLKNWKGRFYYSWLFDIK